MNIKYKNIRNENLVIVKLYCRQRSTTVSRLYQSQILKSICHFDFSIALIFHLYFGRYISFVIWPVMSSHIHTHWYFFHLS